jgi:uncharacterized membrane protein YozB (DUF420 family)
MDLRLQAGFLGTNAPLSSDLTLVAYVLLLVPAMVVGYVFARRKMFVPYHKLTMSAITVFNWVLAGIVMVVSYRSYVAPELPERIGFIGNLLPTAHLAVGALAQGLATYLVLRMWLERVLPGWLLIRNIKRWMRLTLLLWFTTAALGIALYFVWWTPQPLAGGGGAPVATPDVTPDVTADAPAATPDASPGETPDVVVTDEAPAPIETPEAQPGGLDDLYATVTAQVATLEALQAGAGRITPTPPAATEDIRPAETPEAGP